MDTLLTCLGAAVLALAFFIPIAYMHKQDLKHEKKHPEYYKEFDWKE